MQILVDYDNIPKTISRGGSRYLADRLLEGLQGVAMSSLLADRRLDLRFYGGWYSGQNLSSLAQALSAEIQNAFPYSRRLNPANPGSAISVMGALAFSLLILPRHTLYRTFRQRPGLGKVDCADPKAMGCADLNCPLEIVADYLTTNRCPQNGCQVNTNTFIKPRSEQKLVDTMLIADLIHLSQTKEPVAAVVTLDDDIWPGVISAMQHGTHIIHISTKYHEPRPFYVSGIPGKCDSVPL